MRRLRHKVSFLSEVLKVWIQCFSSLSRLPYHAKKPSLSNYFTHNWRGNCWIHTFSHQYKLLLKSEWQQVTTGLQDSSQYSSRFQQCCSLNDLDSFSDLQRFQSFGTIPSAPITNCIIVTRMFHIFLAICHPYNRTQKKKKSQETTQKNVNINVRNSLTPRPMIILDGFTCR